MDRKKLIYIVEDEPEMLNMLGNIISKNGYDVKLFSNGKEALNSISVNYPDLILLDLMLPDISGLEVCRSLKNDSKTWNIPIIAVTSKSDEFDVMTGFNLGCDDYVTKPFSYPILLARIDAIFRRDDRKSESNQIVKFKDLVLDQSKYEAKLNGTLLNLTAFEFNVITLLIKNQGRVFSRLQILEEIREDNLYDAEERSIDSLISRLRKKLGEYGQYIESIYGVGYCFKESDKV